MLFNILINISLLSTDVIWLKNPFIFPSSKSKKIETCFTNLHSNIWIFQTSNKPLVSHSAIQKFPNCNAERVKR